MNKYYHHGKLPNATKKGSFWWRDNLKLLDKYKGLASVQISDGKTCLLWWDLWDGQVCAQIYPHLLSYAKLKNISLHRISAMPSIEQLFHLPLSAEAYAQLLLLCDRLDGLNLNTEQDI